MGRSAASRQVRGPSAAAGKARGLSAAARQSRGPRVDAKQWETNKNILYLIRRGKQPALFPIETWNKFELYNDQEELGHIPSTNNNVEAYNSRLVNERMFLIIFTSQANLTFLTTFHLYCLVGLRVSPEMLVPGMSLTPSKRRMTMPRSPSWKTTRVW